MREEEIQNTGGLSVLYPTYGRQRCFIGHTHEGYTREVKRRDDILEACEQVLPKFSLEPWYADHPSRFDPTMPLRDKIVEMIANARYGIYDLSYWQKDRNNDKSEWIIPRNVFIELGMAIALNRPTLLLQRAESREKGPGLPKCLDSKSSEILVYSGGQHTLKQALEKGLQYWVNVSPKQAWLNRFCIFGDQVCQYREVHPRLKKWERQTLLCHISDGENEDFRHSAEEVLERFNDLSFIYLDALSLTRGYNHLLCSHCQTIRSTSFAIYRITPKTPGEVFIAIGMSIALETLFKYKIPKILFTEDVHDVPSLLSGYQVVVAQSDTEIKARLIDFVPTVKRLVYETPWKDHVLPFFENVLAQHEKPLPNGEQIVSAEEPSPLMQVVRPLQAEQQKSSTPVPDARQADTARVPLQNTNFERKQYTVPVQWSSSEALKKAQPSLWQRFVENPLERLAEGFLPSQIEPAGLIAKLERAMEDNLFRSLDRLLAPDVYDIYLSIADHRRLSPGWSVLRNELQDHLIKFARRHHYTLRIVPVLRLHADSILHIGEVRIEAELGGDQYIHVEEKFTPTQALNAQQRAELHTQLPPGEPLPSITNPGNLTSSQLGNIPTGANATGSSIGLIPQARLTIRLPQVGQQIYQIEKPIINLGRQLSNDIIVEDKRVSRYHAQIKYMPDGQFVIFDLGSTNGITINGVPNMRQHTLRSGDHFTIGNYDFYFERK